VGGPDVAREARDTYLDLAGDGRVDEAVDLCLELLDAGLAPEAIALQLLGAAQREVGRRWSLGTWTVAQEHAASAVTDAVLAALTAAGPSVTLGEPLVVVACPRTEWHGLAARMVTQILRWRGVAADCVGTLASDAALDELLGRRRPRALALSCTMTSALPDVARAVAVAGRHGTAVVGGGQGFGPDGRYARSVGVAEWVAGAPQLTRRLARWDRTGWPARAHPVPEPIDYRRLVRRRRELAGAVATRLMDDELGADDVELVRDAAEQVVAVALSATRTGHGSILGDGVAELSVALARRPGPVSAVGARLPAVVHEVLDRRAPGYLGADEGSGGPVR
jgi:methanogenic corrinoid protein MtbC1